MDTTTVYLIIWGVVFAAMVVAELQSLQFVSIWFAAGAAAAFITALFGVEMWIQLIVFAVISLALLLFTRPLLQKFSIEDDEPTDVNINIGKTAVVIEEINNTSGKGRARLDGVDWKAVSLDNRTVPQGKIVEVYEIKGTRLYVMPAKKK